MGRWPISSNASILDCSKDIDPSYSSNGCCIAPDCLVEESYASVDYGDCKAALRCSFEKILSFFLKEIGRRGIVRPVPALLGEGGSLDLFELFMVVRDKGGYQVVSEKELWSSVVVELGLDLELSASVKLVYSKYLSELENWLMVRCGGTKLENGNSDYHCEKSFPFSSELAAKIKGMLYGVLKQKSLYDECSGFISSKQIGNINVASAAVEKKIKLPEVNKKEPDLNGSVTQSQEKLSKTPQDDDGIDHIRVNEDCRSLDSVNVETKTDSCESCRESLLRMLKWARQIAKYPADPSNGTIPGPSKWKEYTSNNTFWLQVVRAKDALLIRKDVEENNEKRLLQVDFTHLFCLSAGSLSPLPLFSWTMNMHTWILALGCNYMRKLTYAGIMIFGFLFQDRCFLITVSALFIRI